MRTVALSMTLAACLATVTGLVAEAQQRPVSHPERAAAAATAAIPDRVRAARAPEAVLRGLDKIAGTTTEMILSAGESARLGRLEIRLGECRYPVDDPESDAFAQLVITDLSAGKMVFSGWMIASSPALSALDDARYDVWVVHCQSASASGNGPDSTAGTDSASDSSE